MNYRSKIFLCASLVAFSPVYAAPQAAAPAAAPAQLAAGAAVKDTSGGEVGTITSIDGEFVVVKTDKYEARLPRTSLTPTAEGALIGLTRAELNASIEQTMAQAGPVLTAGATVRDTAGNTVGTVGEFDAEFATITLTSNTQIRLPVGAFARGPNGPIIGMTAAELEAAAKGAAAPAPAAAQ